MVHSRDSEFVATDAMREQSVRNEFDSETLGLQREAELTQKQLALHTLRDRAEHHIDYNEGLAEGAEGLAEMAEGGGLAGDSFGAMAAAATRHAEQWAQRKDHVDSIADELPAE